LFQFVRARRKYFLLPILFASALLGGLLVLTSGSAVTPFLYALF